MINDQTQVSSHIINQLESNGIKYNQLLRSSYNPTTNRPHCPRVPPRPYQSAHRCPSRAASPAHGPKCWDVGGLNIV